MTLVTLTTDYGLRDYYVADLKGRIFSHIPDVNIVDVSHDIVSHDIIQAAFYIKNIFSEFPEKTIHTIAVNIDYGNLNLLIAKKDNRYIIAPDNGIISLIHDEYDEVFALKYAISKSPDIKIFGDSLAHTIACLGHGLDPNDFAQPYGEYERFLNIVPVITEYQIRATIIDIDKYENVILNITKKMFEEVAKGRKFELYYQQNNPITSISDRYHGRIGEPLCLFNSAGYLQISLNKDKASSMLNLFKHQIVQINFYD